MASLESNGYASQQPYENQSATQGSNSTGGNSAAGSFNAESANTPSSGNTASAHASESNGSVAKDEVGWYFVEQYYTTLSKNPDKLHVSILSYTFRKAKRLTHPILR